MFEYWFIGGPQSIESGMFTDGPMHKKCAEFSGSLCPFLNGKRQECNARPVELEKEYRVIKNEQVATVRPHKMAIRRVRKYVIGKISGSENIVYHIQQWANRPKWF